MNVRVSLKVVCFLAIGIGAAIVFSEAIEGTPEIAQKEGLGCLVCHTALGRADLNDRGLYYKKERTLEGYRAPEAPPAGEPAADEPPKGGDAPGEARPVPEPARESPR